MDIIELPAGLGDSAMLALIVGFLSPLILNFVVSALWPKWVKSLVALAWSAIVGVATAFLAGAFDGLSIVSTILLVLVVTITSYQNFWKQVAPNMQRGSTEKKAIEAKVAEATVDAVAATAAIQVIASGAIERAVVEEHPLQPPE